MIAAHRRPRRQNTTRSTHAATVDGDESPVEVLAGEQRERRELAQRLARRVGVHRGHAGRAAVEREQHVERLGAADLADDDPVGSHAQALAHEVAQA